MWSAASALSLVEVARRRFGLGQGDRSEAKEGHKVGVL